MFRAPAHQSFVAPDCRVDDEDPDLCNLGLPSAVALKFLLPFTCIKISCGEMTAFIEKVDLFADPENPRKPEIVFFGSGEPKMTPYELAIRSGFTAPHRAYSKMKLTDLGNISLAHLFKTFAVPNPCGEENFKHIMAVAANYFCHQGRVMLSIGGKVYALERQGDVEEEEEAEKETDDVREEAEEVEKETEEGGAVAEEE